MNRFDITSETGLQVLDNLAAKLAPHKAENQEPNKDNYGSGITSIGDLPCLSGMPTIPITFLLEGIIAYGAITVFVGPSGCGKTSVLTAAAAAIADGEPFAGLKTLKAPVLHLDRENGLSVVQERLSRLSVSTGPNYKIWGCWAGYGPPPVDAEILKRYVNECDPKPLIIVDSLVAFHPGNENDARETRAYFNMLRPLVGLGAAVVLIHHNGKADSAQQYRGSSDILAATDIAFSVRNSGGNRLERVQFEAFKSRFTVREQVTFQYEDGKFATTGDRLLSNADNNLKDLLIANPGIRYADFEDKAKAEGIPRTEVRKFLTEGERNDRLTKSGSKNKGYSYTWGSLIEQVNSLDQPRPSGTPPCSPSPTP